MFLYFTSEYTKPVKGAARLWANMGAWKIYEHALDNVCILSIQFVALHLKSADYYLAANILTTSSAKGTDAKANACVSLFVIYV